MTKNIPACKTDILIKRAPDHSKKDFERRLWDWNGQCWPENLVPTATYLLGLLVLFARHSGFSVCQKTTLHSHNCCQLLTLMYSRKVAGDLLRSVVSADLGHSRSRKKLA